MGLLILSAGCGSQLATGSAGILGGFTASETLKGLQADLDRREQSLIAHYNELVDAGVKAEALEDVKKQIANTIKLKQVSETAGEVMKTNWSDPAAAGGAIGSIAMLGYALLNKRKATAAGNAIRTIRAGSDEANKHQIDKIVLEKKATV